MMRFTINLATRTYLDHKLVNRLIYAIALLAMALLVWNVTRFSHNLGKADLLKTNIAALEERLNRVPAGVSENEFKLLKGSIQFYNNIIERKAFDWAGLLGRLENATPAGIALASVAPDRKTGQIKIEGRTKSFAQLRAYLEKLEDSGSFNKILLQSHQDMTGEEGMHGIQFTLSCGMMSR